MTNEQKYYENPELWERDRFGPADQERYATLADKLPLDVGTLLDVGCGNGLFLKRLSGLKGRHFERLCGVERSAAALAKVEHEKVEASVDSLPFLKDEFDAVSCQEVLEHLPQTTFVSALNELSRIARRYILVSVPFNDQLRLSLTECAKCCCRFNPTYHLRSFDELTMRHLFDGKGFICREVFYMHARPAVPRGIESMLRFFGVAKRTFLRQACPAMVDHAVCPACGYCPRIDSREVPITRLPPTNSLGTRVRSLLSLKSEWRWIGALYQRR